MDSTKRCGVFGRLDCSDVRCDRTVEVCPWLARRAGDRERRPESAEATTIGGVLPSLCFFPLLVLLAAWVSMRFPMLPMAAIAAAVPKTVMIVSTRPPPPSSLVSAR